MGRRLHGEKGLGRIKIQAPFPVKGVLGYVGWPGLRVELSQALEKGPEEIMILIDAAFNGGWRDIRTRDKFRPRCLRVLWYSRIALAPTLATSVSSRSSELRNTKSISLAL